MITQIAEALSSGNTVALVNDRGLRFVIARTAWHDLGVYTREGRFLSAIEIELDGLHLA